MSESNNISFKISFKKDIFELNYSPDSTVQDIKTELELKIGIETQYQKLLFKGILKNDSTLKDSGILSGSKIILIATPPEDIQAIRNTEDKVKNRYQLPSANVFKTSSKPSKHTFHILKVLPEFHSQDKALEYLKRLKNDAGILGIMEKHKWEVGELIELSPSEKSILGYNRNKGETIAVRIRTDDLTGFIHYPTVRKVLLHELAHMIHSEHDAKFYKLNRELNKEVLELDWSRKGNKLSNEQFHKSDREDKGSNQTGYRLGGKKLDSQLFNSSSQYRRSTISKAVELRLSKEEIELEQACQTQVPPSDQS